VGRGTWGSRTNHVKHPVLDFAFFLRCFLGLESSGLPFGRLRPEPGGKRSDLAVLSEAGKAGRSDSIASRSQDYTKDPIRTSNPQPP
jgi:hypothetical protein